MRLSNESKTTKLHFLMFNFSEAKEVIFFKSVDLHRTSTDDYQLLSLNLELIKIDKIVFCYKGNRNNVNLHNLQGAVYL